MNLLVHIDYVDYDLLPHEPTQESIIFTVKILFYFLNEQIKNNSTNQTKSAMELIFWLMEWMIGGVGWNWFVCGLWAKGHLRS